MSGLDFELANARAAAFDFFNMAAAYRERAENSNASNRWRHLLLESSERLDAAGTEAVRAVRVLLRRGQRPESDRQAIDALNHSAARLKRPARHLFGLDRP